MKSSRVVLASAGAVFGAATALWAVRLYNRQKQAAVRSQAGSHVIETAAGPVEYSESGSGPAVLISHGAGGSLPHALQFASPDAGMRFLSVSRPGFGCTPLTTGRTFEEQADLFAALLDSLGIHQAAVIASSTGGPAAIQFALRHPDRCSALALVSAISQPLEEIPPGARLLAASLAQSDFISWLLLNTPLAYLLPGPQVLSQLMKDRETMALYTRMAGSLFPASRNRIGLLNDLEQLRRMAHYPLEEILAPTLVIHGDSDCLAPFEHGRWSAGRIPEALLLVIENGGHFSFITHIHKTRQALNAFLRARSPA